MNLVKFDKSVYKNYLYLMRDCCFIFQFRNINRYDAGQYVCIASNFAGTAQAVAEVSVNGKNA